MNYMRVVLYGLLIVVLVVLFGEWQHDHNAPVADAHTSVVKGQLQTIVKAQTPQASNSSASSQQVITIHTDTLNVGIDTQGGNIISVELPQYPASLHAKQAYSLLNDNQTWHYTASSGLLGSTEQAIHYSAAQSNYTLAKGEKSLQVVLQGTTNNGLQISKIFTFHPNSYLVDVSYHITNQSNQQQTAQLYLQINRTDAKPIISQGLRIHSFYGFATWLPPNGYQGYKFSYLDKHDINASAEGGWLAMSQHYFLSSWIPDPKQTYQYQSKVSNDGIYSIEAISPSITIPTNKTIDLNAHFYAGPKINQQLDAAAPGLKKTIDYGWLWPISIIIFWLMSHIQSIIGNWGWSIVIVTAIIKLIFWKPSASSYRSMAAMRSLQPKLAALKESCGDDKQKYSKEMMQLYRKEKINPLGGCLPILIQIPFFIALYWVLVASVQLRQAPFIFWIHDLAAKDPYGILPILMAASMFVMQKLNPPPPDPMQARIMMALPLFMLVLFWNFQSGLVLYMLVNNLISVIQQWWIMKNYKNNPKKKQWQRTKYKKK